MEHSKNEAGLKNVHYSKCQLFIGDFEFPPRGKAIEARTLPYVRPLFACSSYLIGVSVSSLPASAPRNPTGNPWVPAMNGTASQRERHQGSLGLAIPRAASKFPGRSDQNAPDMNVRRVFLHAQHDSETCPKATLYTAKAEDVMAVTYEPFTLPSDESAAVPLVDAENDYIQSVLDPEKRTYDAAIPVELHLQKELSNPHSRAKKQARWQAALSRRREILAQYVRNELKDLKGRTRREARAEAVWSRWVHRGGEAAALRQKGRRARKERKQDERLRNLVLKEEPNQIVPAAP